MIVASYIQLQHFCGLCVLQCENLINISSFITAILLVYCLNIELVELEIDETFLEYF